MRAFKDARSIDERPPTDGDEIFTRIDIAVRVLSLLNPGNLPSESPMSASDAVRAWSVCAGLSECVALRSRILMTLYGSDHVVGSGLGLVGGLTPDFNLFCPKKGKDRGAPPTPRGLEQLAFFLSLD